MTEEEIRMIDFDQLQKEFVEEAKQSISKWMLEKYPGFDTNLSIKWKRLEDKCDQAERDIQSYYKLLREKEKTVFETVKNDISQYMNKTYPDLSDKVYLVGQEIKMQANTVKKELKYVEEKLKTLTNHQSLCDDVYAMRDKMKELEKTFTDFKKKMKDFFK